MARGLFTGVLVAVGLFALAGLMVLLALSSHRDRGFTAFYLFCSALVWCSLAVAFVARRRSGPLLLDLGRRRSNLIAMIILEAVFVPGLLATLVREHSALGFSKSAFDLSFALLFLYVGLSARQLREAGLLLPFQLIRWDRIASHAWRGRNGNSLVLHLKRRSRLTGKNLRAGVVPRSRKAAAEEILRARVAAATPPAAVPEAGPAVGEPAPPATEAL